MRISAIESWSVTMRLSEPYEIASGRFDSATNVFVRLDTDGGPSGAGCAAPDPAVTGEQPDAVLASYRTALPELVVGADPLRWALVLARLEEHGLGPAARAGVDMALFDLLGKVAGLPLSRLLGGFRDEIVTSVTIGIMGEDETVERARDLVRRGFRALKIKGGRDVELDTARLRRVREAVGPGVELRFDANQGYTAEQALRFVAEAEDLGLEVLEQPTSRDVPALLGRVTEETGIQVMADESLLGLRDVYRLAHGGLVDLLNVKLMKVGGIGEALEVHGAARAAGLDLMVGCMDESALAIAAGLHFALARPGVLYADLDGHLDLLGDPASGAVVLQDGVLRGTGRPGLGHEVRPPG